MNVSVEDRSSNEAIARDLVGGALRRELGLELSELRLGLDVAKRQLQRGAYAEAMRIYIALVVCEPTEVDFQVGLANCALQIEENALALQAASAVIALAPRDCRGYLLSGRACLALGHQSEAEEDLRDAVTFGQAERNATVVNDAKRLLQSIAGVNA